MVALIYPLATIAFFMVLFLSALIAKSVRVRTGIDSVVVIVLLGMMIGMLIGPTYLYLTKLILTAADVGIWEIAVFSGAGMMPVIALVSVRYVMETDPGRKGPLPLTNLLDHPRALRTAYVSLLVLSEVLMGWAFNIASGLVKLSSGYSPGEALSHLAFALTNYWFVFTMAAEMFLTLLALRKLIEPDLLKVLALQAVVMMLAPTALPSEVWELYSFYLEAAAMTAVFAFAIWYVRTRVVRDWLVVRLVLFFVVANAVMMAGLLWWLVSGDVWVLAPILVSQTLVYFGGVVTGGGRGASELGARAPPSGAEATTTESLSMDLRFSCRRTAASAGKKKYVR